MRFVFPSCKKIVISSAVASSKLVDLEYKGSVTALATPARHRRSAPASTSRPKGRRLKLFRKKTFLVNNTSKSASNSNQASEDEQEAVGGHKSHDNNKLRIVQFNQETTLSKSIRRKAPSKLEGMGPAKPSFFCPQFFKCLFLRP